jgi:succinate dehydrogenase / fumarate reductase cytochrome b subunit
MANIFTSSIGKKLIMSISGAFLVLFLLFHMVMNAVLIFSDEAYNAVCAFLGANWYAVAGTAVLAVGAFVHILYASILTIQNMRARGKQRYAARGRSKGVEWASKNMYILGAIVLGGIFLHLYHFWWNMMLTELMGEHINQFGQDPANGAWLVRMRFSDIWYVVGYLAWFAAIWLHLTHGIWSMFQTVGWNSKVWMKRMKWISSIGATLLIGGFALVVVIVHIQGILL